MAREDGFHQSGTSDKNLFKLSAPVGNTLRIGLNSEEGISALWSAQRSCLPFLCARPVNTPKHI